MGTSHACLLEFLAGTSPVPNFKWSSVLTEPHQKPGLAGDGIHTFIEQPALTEPFDVVFQEPLHNGVLKVQPNLADTIVTESYFLWLFHGFELAC